MSKAITAGTAAVTLALLSGAALADDMVYAGFPVTVKGYSGSKTTSVSYTGQIARHVLHDSLKKLAGSGNGKPNPELKAKMMAYFGGKDAGREIIAPATKGPFAISQSAVDDISSGDLTPVFVLITAAGAASIASAWFIRPRRRGAIVGVPDPAVR